MLKNIRWKNQTHRSLKQKVSENRKFLLQMLILLTALLFLAAGIHRNEAALVLNKAIHICMECIGLG